MNSSKDPKRKDSILGMLVLLFLLLVFIFMTLSNKEDSKEEILKSNVKTFMKGETLICSVSALKSSVKFQVSQSRGWHIQRDSFAKGDMLIEVCACNKSLPMTKGGR